MMKNRELGTVRPKYPDPRIQMKARAPIGRFTSGDVKTSIPMPLKIIEPKAVTTPEPVKDTMGRVIMPRR
ncbi:hypothetical protein E5D57_010306 [Metarhizium anisopliae]|nr:hypothetical protein E5D57_010306 [Metarhizium anisopliae]